MKTIRKTASLNELKKELNTLSKSEIAEICLKLTKFKKENKELLNYLLFEAQNEPLFIENVKAIADIQFEELQKGNLYLANKGLRKILKSINKSIKISGNKQTEVELLIYFCFKLKKSGIKMNHSTALSNLYQLQLKKIEKLISKLHEDLQFDFQMEIDKLL